MFVLWVESIMSRPLNAYIEVLTPSCAVLSHSVMSDSLLPHEL